MVSIVSILLGMILLVNSGQEVLPLDLEKLERASEENPVQAFETLSGYVSPSLVKNNNMIIRNNTSSLISFAY
ncbi:hypothetical protein SAMN04488104_102536 [Algoriphagus faecimaris]|uniref:Uncharacterized protein n=1 Tax=Algoriphagus faecimaris TaxID=686796 RepID=A0A1G6TZR9_9BACT|nr:hypothetical protein [Algoriphagus faecimaris]SDD34573.1 hypothetical protein SAMN04488104_102536 [Algoriphagus faecimaris]